MDRSTLHPRRHVAPWLLAGALALGACSTASTDTADEAADSTTAPPSTSPAEPAATTGSTAGDAVAVTADGDPGLAWAALSQDERNDRCSAHLDSPDQIWESMSSDGASEDEIVAYQAMLDVECDGGR